MYHCAWSLVNEQVINLKQHISTSRAGPGARYYAASVQCSAASNTMVQQLSASHLHGPTVSPGIVYPLSLVTPTCLTPLLNAPIRPLAEWFAFVYYRCFP